MYEMKIYFRNKLYHTHRFVDMDGMLAYLECYEDWLFKKRNKASVEIRKFW